MISKVSFNLFNFFLFLFGLFNQLTLVTCQSNITIIGWVRDASRSLHPDFNLQHQSPCSQSGSLSKYLSPRGKPILIPYPQRNNSLSNCATTIPSQNIDYTHHSRADFDTWFNDDPLSFISYPYPFILKQLGNSSLYQWDSSIDGDTPGYFMPLQQKGYFGRENLNGRGYGFTTEIKVLFYYRGGETFSFSGDDDVWVYINNVLVLDLGGMHSILTSSFALDTIANSTKIIKGNTYEMYIIHAERFPTGSNFKMTTSILPTNTPPIIYNSSFNMFQNSNSTITLTATDSDPWYQILTAQLLAIDYEKDLNCKGVIGNFTSLNSLINSTFILGTNSTIFIKPPINWFGQIKLYYKVKDDGGLWSNVGQVMVVVNHVNQPPIPINGFIECLQDDVIVTTANATDVDSQELSFSKIQNSNLGYLDISSNGTIVYNCIVPGIEKIKFGVWDGDVNWSIQIGFIDVVVVRKYYPPIALNYTLECRVPQICNFTLNATDKDTMRNALQFGKAVNSRLGYWDISLNGSSWFKSIVKGNETLEYFVSDGYFLSKGYVNVQVLPALTIPPVVVNGTVDCFQGQHCMFQLNATDLDTPFSNLTFGKFDNSIIAYWNVSKNGLVDVNGVIPGNDLLKWWVFDGNDVVYGHLNLTILEIPTHPPIPVNTSLVCQVGQVCELQLHAIDVDNDTLLFVKTDNSKLGYLNINSTGYLTFSAVVYDESFNISKWNDHIGNETWFMEWEFNDPNVDLVEWFVTDGKHVAKGWIWIRTLPVPHYPPLPTNMSVVVTEGDDVVLKLEAKDEDTLSSELRFWKSQNSKFGYLDIFPNGTLHYQGVLSGIEQLEYFVEDGRFLVKGYLNILVKEKIRYPPVPYNITLIVDVNHDTMFQLDAMDVDTPRQDLTFHKAENSRLGYINFNVNGTGNFTGIVPGNETLGYWCWDGKNATLGYLFITVKSIPTYPPEPSNVTIYLRQGESTKVSLQVVDRDTPFEDLLFVKGENSKLGYCNVTKNGILEYKAVLNGFDLFEYLVWDPLGGYIVKGWISVYVEEFVTFPPVAKNTSLSLDRDANVTIQLQAEDVDSTELQFLKVDNSILGFVNVSIDGIFDFWGIVGGQDLVPFGVWDGQHLSFGWVNVTVVTYPPHVNNVSINCTQGDTIQFDLNVTDKDSPRKFLTFYMVNSTTLGPINLSTQGNVSFTCVYNGTEIVPYQVMDEDGHFDEAWFEITILPLPPYIPPLSSGAIGGISVGASISVIVIGTIIAYALYVGFIAKKFEETWKKEWLNAQMHENPLYTPGKREVFNPLYQGVDVGATTGVENGVTSSTLLKRGTSRIDLP